MFNFKELPIDLKKSNTQRKEEREKEKEKLDNQKQKEIQLSEKIVKDLNELFFYFQRTI